MPFPLKYVLLTLPVPDDLSKLELFLALCKECDWQGLSNEDIRILASLKYFHKFLLVKDYSETTIPLPGLKLDVSELLVGVIEQDLDEL